MSTRDDAADRSTFESVLGEMFGIDDPAGWSRFAKAHRSGGSATKLVLAVDAAGMPLPPAGARPEGYTLGAVVTVEITEIDVTGVARPSVHVNVWDPRNRRLIGTGHSSPSVSERDAITGGDPADPSKVDAVLSEYEESLDDAVRDALGQIAGDGSIVVPSQHLPPQPHRPAGDDAPSSPIASADDPAVHETTPWTDPDLHETTPWTGPDPSDDHTGDSDQDAVDDQRADDGDAAPGDGAPAEDLDPGEWEAFPGQDELLAELEAEYEPEPLDLSFLDPDQRDEEASRAEPPAPRPTSVRWIGPVGGRTALGTPLSVEFVDAAPARDADGQPIPEISGSITTSAGIEQPVRLYLASGGAEAPDGAAVYRSRPLTVEGGPDSDALPMSDGDGLAVTVGGRSANVDRVYAKPLDLALWLQRQQLEKAGILLADILRSYKAETDGFHDDPTIALNLQVLTEGVRTAQLGLEHFEDEGLPIEKVGRAQYYLDHLPLYRQNLEFLAEGRTMISPFDDDIRNVKTLKHDLSLISFYQNDITIREHFDTLVEDADATGRFVKGNAIGRSFNDIYGRMLDGSYDAIVGETAMAWMYPLLDQYFSGKMRDHRGHELAYGERAQLGISIGLMAASRAREALQASGRLSAAESTALRDAGTSLQGEIEDLVTDKGMDVVVSAASKGASAAIDDAAARSGLRQPGTSPHAAEAGGEVAGPSRKVRKAVVGGVAAVVLVGGGVFIATSGGDEDPAAAPSAPAAVATVTPTESPASGDPDLPPPATDSQPDEPTQSVVTTVPEPTAGEVDPPQLEPDPDVPVPEDTIFDVALPEPPLGAIEAAADYGGPTVQELMLLPAPDGSSEDDELRRGGGALRVTVTYVVDWQDLIVGDNFVIEPGYLFPAGMSFEDELIIWADCAGTSCAYSMDLATGEMLRFQASGRTLFGSVAGVTDAAGSCDREITVTLKVSDFQTINNRLVPDAVVGGRIESGMCESAVYREISYEGGYAYIGSLADQ